jgi:hypothetical protein
MVLAAGACLAGADDNLPKARPLFEGGASLAVDANPLAARQRREVARIVEQHGAQARQRREDLRGRINARKDSWVNHGKQTEACFAGPRILEVVPTNFMPGDPVVVNGCGFLDGTGMLLLSEGKRQFAIEHWSDTRIEGTVPAMSGFVEAKNVSVSVITVDAGKSTPSSPLTLEPKLVLKEILPLGVDLSGCGDRYQYGIVEHRPQGNEAPSCGQGIDTVRFGIQLKNNWTFHSLVFNALCTASHTACGGANTANAMSGAYQLGKSYLPDLKVNWKGYVAYYPAIMAMGPEGTPAQ